MRKASKRRLKQVKDITFLLKYLIKYLFFARSLVKKSYHKNKQYYALIKLKYDLRFHDNL